MNSSWITTIEGSKREEEAIITQYIIEWTVKISNIPLETILHEEYFPCKDLWHTFFFFLSPPLSLPMLRGGKGERVRGSAGVAMGERGIKEGSGNKNNDCEGENALRTSPSPHAQKGRVRVCVYVSVCACFPLFSDYF